MLPCESCKEPPDTRHGGATTDVDISTPASETSDKLWIYQAHARCGEYSQKLYYVVVV